MTHSPLPWRIDGDKIIDSSGCGIATDYVDWPIPDEDNMEIIVTAVNAHAALVAALEAIVNDQYCKPILGSLGIRARAALELARKGGV